jgi:hypothetical protein
MRMWKCLVFEIREHGGLRVYDRTGGGWRTHFGILSAC